MSIGKPIQKLEYGDARTHSQTHTERKSPTRNISLKAEWETKTKQNK
jgi:hypothetical protein